MNDIGFYQTAHAFLERRRPLTCPKGSPGLLCRWSVLYSLILQSRDKIGTFRKYATGTRKRENGKNNGDNMCKEYLSLVEHTIPVEDSNRKFLIS